MNSAIELLTLVIVLATLVTVYLIHRHLQLLAQRLTTIETQSLERFTAITRHINFWDAERDKLIQQVELLNAVNALLRQDQQLHRQQAREQARVKLERRTPTPGPSRRH